MLQEWSTETGLRADLGAREWKIESLHGPPQRILPMPYGKALADPKFLNWNLASIFIDEAPQMPEGSRRHLVSRLRSGNMLRAVWCYNPVDRNSFKKGIHDPVSRGDIAGKVFRFKLSDNPGLPQGYRAMQEANYPAGADRIRYIEGEWAAQEGLVYDQRFELYDLNPARSGYAPARQVTRSGTRQVSTLTTDQVSPRVCWAPDTGRGCGWLTSTATTGAPTGLLLQRSLTTLSGSSLGAGRCGCG